MTKPTISVVIPTYNAADTIEKCIESVFNQNYPKDKVEVIVVNNASTDSTLERLEIYKNKIKIITQENMGPAGSKDTGLKAAIGEIICTLSPDSYAVQDWFNNLSEAFKDPEVGVVQGKILPYKDASIPFYHMSILKKEVWNYPTVAIAYRAEAVDRAGRYYDFELSYFGDDTDLAWRIIGTGYRSKWLMVVTAYHDVIPKTFWGILKVGKGSHRIPFLFKKRPELRKFLWMRFLYSRPWTLLNILLIFLVPYFLITNPLYLEFTLIIIYGMAFLNGMKHNFYNKCNFIYKLTLIPLNFFLLEVVVFFSIMYGIIKHRSFIL